MPLPERAQWAQTGPFGIATVAGTLYDPSGDGGPATSASVGLLSVAFQNGNLYLTDGARIRKVAPSGTITTVVGLLDPVAHQPIAGFSGDGGPALGAQIRGASYLEFDSAGNLFIADAGNSCIRRVTARVAGGVAQPFDGSEIITTVAGTPLSVGKGGDGLPATSAQLNNPRAIAFNSSGEFYIADSNNNNIRKVDAAGTITTFAGTGMPGPLGDLGPAVNATFNLPLGVTVDPATGDVYVADVLNNRVRKIAAATGIITTAAGTGAHSSSGNPNDVTPAKAKFVNGSLYVVDSGVGAIRKIDPANGIITTIAGVGLGSAPVGDGGPAISAKLGSGPGGIQDVALEASSGLFLTDESSRRVRFVASSSGPATIFGQTVAAGNIATVAGPAGLTFSGDGGPASAARFFGPGSLAFDPCGNLYVTDSGNNRVRRIDGAGTITTIAGNGRPDYDPTLVPGIATAAQLQPGSLAFYAGALYLTNNSLRVLKVAGNAISVVANTTGTPTPPSADGTLAINAQMAASNIAFDAAGNLYVGDPFNFRIWKIDSTGTVKTVVGSGAVIIDGTTVLSATAKQAKLFGPGFIAFDPSGNVYSTDGPRNRILKVTAHGFNQPLDGTETVTIFAGTGTFGFSGDSGPASAAKLNGPIGLAFDGTGNLYFDDSSNFRVRKIDTNGIITTVAGTGVASFGGDGGPAISAQIRGGPLAFASCGDLYLSDGVNQVIRVLAPSLSSGAHCNVIGTFNGDVNVKNGQLVMSLCGSATGNITQTDGSLANVSLQVSGDVEVNGGGGFSVEWKVKSLRASVPKT
jgi:sugar lactone lactonase YvrE